MMIKVLNKYLENYKGCQWSYPLCLVNDSKVAS